MPTVLRAAMLVHDGGTIADAFEPGIDIRSLDEWEVLDEDDLELFDLQSAGPPYITFADNDHGGLYVLDYHRCTAAGEPAVMSLYHDGLDRDDKGADVASFLARLASSLSDTPAINGGHSAHLTRISQTQLVTKTTAQHCLLGRDCDGRLILMEYQVGNDEERWTTTFLPEPLVRRNLTITRVGDGDHAGYQLGLCPQQGDQGREWESCKQSSGRWKNDFKEGVPGGTSMYSLDLEPLILLRQLLAGPPQTQAQAEADALCIEYLRLTAACTTKERRAADWYMTEVVNKQAMADFDEDFGLDDDENDEGTAAAVPDASSFLSQTNAVMSKLQGMATMFSGGDSKSKVPEALRQLIERLVAAEAAVEKEDG